LRTNKTINQVGQEFDVHPAQVVLWKKAVQDQAKTLFEGKRGPKVVDAETGIHTVVDAPAQHFAAVPIDHYGQVHKTLGQSNVGDVGAPDLVGSGDLHTP